MTRLGRRRWAVVLLAATVAGGMAVAAWAFWTTSGSGSASASVGTLTSPGLPTTAAGPSNVTVTWGAATVSGGGTVKYHVERRTSPGTNWTDVCGSTALAPITAVSCIDAPAFGTYVYRVTAHFASWTAVGPESDPVTSSDPTPPTFGSPALSLAAAGPFAFYPGSGTTAYYNGATGASSSITVGAPNVADPDSGIQKVNFPAPAGLDGGGDDLASPYSATYTWTTGTGTGSQTVTATNGGGSTTTTAFTLARDVTAPTGGAVTVAGASTNNASVNNTSGTYTVAGLSQYAETQTATASGLASSSLVREQATFNPDGTCSSTWTNATTIAANRTENAGTGIVTGRCYRYTLTGTDNVANTASIQITVKVDTTGPAFGSPALTFSDSGPTAFYPGSGTRVYYGNPGTSSSITVSAPNAADADSGIQKVNFPAPAGLTGGGDDLASPYSATYTWTTGTGNGSQTVTATNGAGTTATTTFNLTQDVTAPSGGAVTVAGTSTNNASVTNTSGTYTVAGLSQYAETQTATASGLASSSLVREQATFDPDGTCGSTWTNATTIAANRTENAGTGIVTGRCYRYTLTGTDNVANTASIQITVKVDTTGPAFGSPALNLATAGAFAFYPGAGTTVYYNGTTGTASSITVSAPNVADPESSIQKVNFPSPAGLTGGGDDLASQYSATYTWTTGTGTGSQTVTATNGAGSTATTTFTLARDITAPAGGALNVAGTSTNNASVNNTTGSYSIATLTQYAETQTATASGLSSSSLVRDETTFDPDGTCGSTWTNATTISATRTENAGVGITSGHCYRYTLRGTDNVANSASIQITVKVDTTGPAFGSPALNLATAGAFAFYPGSGTTVYYNGTTGTASSITVSAPNVADADSGIQKVNFPAPGGFSGGGDDLTSPFGVTYTWSSSSASGSQTATATNGVGSTATTTFTLARDITAPTGGALNVAGTSTNNASVNNTTGSYSIATLTQYAEAQTAAASGLASSSLVRDEATYNANGTCGSTWTNATTISATRTENAGTGIASGHCYRYKLAGADNVANSASIQITVKVDTDAPTATNVALANGGTLGRLGQDDTVTIGFSEILDASTVCSTFVNDGSTESRSGSAVTVTATENGANDTLAVSASSGCALHVGTVALGADYVSATKTYSGGGGNSSVVDWNPVAQTLTITLGSGTNGEKTGVAASTPSYTPDAALKDLAGNIIASGPFTGSVSSF